MKRAFLVEETGEELTLSIATTPNIKKALLEITQMPDNSWRLLASKPFVEDFSKVESLSLENKVLTLVGADKSFAISKVGLAQGALKMIEASEDAQGNMKMVIHKSLYPEFKGKMTLKVVRED